MGDTVATAGRLAAAPVSEPTELSPTGELLRDIARGGISGVVAGIVVGGLGGGLVMRIAALLHRNAVGALTENGNRIGDFAPGGTIALLLFGVISCAMAGSVWVIVSPWILGRAGVRALLTAGIAIAIGTPVLIIGGNPDFVILEHDPVVVALLVALTGAIGLSIALFDSWLERRLPHAIVGLCTATWWGLRIRGRASAPPGLVIAARGALLVAVVLGVLTSAPHIVRAFGASS